MDEPTESNAEIPVTTNADEGNMVNGDEPMPDLPQNPTSASDSSSSDSDSEDDESDQKLQLQSLQSQLSSDPSNYDAHVQCIKLLRKIGDIDNLRKAREAMSEIFPLTPLMWQEWAKDEASIDTGPEALAAIERLYERGVFDYLSVSLWRDYLNFVQEYDSLVQNCATSGVKKARDLFERALTAAGLHFTEAEKLWEAYRDFEKAIYQTIAETDTQAKEKQVQLIRSIFHRQLSLPLSNMNSTLEAYKAWEVEVKQGCVLDTESNYSDGVPSQVSSAYRRALDMYNARVQLEEQISKQDLTDTERLHQYIIYLKFEQSAGDPARVQVLFERAIADFPVSVDLWLDYTRYMDKTLKVGNIVRNVYSRATRNCPWIGDLWVRYLLALERARASEGEIASVFEKSLQCSFSTLDEYLDLFLTRIDGLRRRISFADQLEDVLEYSLIKETFQRASDYLSPHLKNSEVLFRLYAYWARLEINLGKDLDAARGVWESLLKICGSLLAAWEGYIAMEIELNHINNARSIYKRCYSKRFPGNGSEDICHSWLRFEREFGSLEDLDHAVRKINPRLEELKSYKLQMDESENPVKQNDHGKRKLGGDAPNVESPAKKLKDSAHGLKKVTEKGKAQSQNVDDQTGDIRGRVKKPDDTSDQQMKDSIQEKGKVYNDQCTAFISNLNLKVTYEHLRDFFQDVGGVVAIRILHDKFTGKSRGLAYVDFSDDAHLDAGVAKNKQLLLGKKISIARSDPKKGGHTTDRAGGGKRFESRSSAKAPQKAHEQPPGARKHGGNNIELKGKNTFAVPRNVRALGWTADKPKTVEQADEKPKTNDEFRKLYFKG
ncbi:squamous cell carcinoma antigen recognized by T-cells 3 isoform X1 [Benincasa hispida]|uniref:squamous cell carcinoma antigen recognized by T-cells 3 isoform X1 n=1 Tax=Benincasa hispida TaxID=102211 RepID=UPI0019002EE9|nr:squamous cell carcinoma antigen recognized by T-cells 3 isoform X1 [Benincasa hispida]